MLHKNQGPNSILFFVLNLGINQRSSSKKSLIIFIHEVMFLEGNSISLLEKNFLNIYTLMKHLQDIREVSSIEKVQFKITILSCSLQKSKSLMK